MNNMDDLSGAVLDFTRAIALAPDDPVNHAGRGTVFMRLMDYDKAIRDFSKALELKPDNMITWFNRGEAWKAKEEYDEALADYDQALRIQPDFDMAFLGKGLIWFIKEEYDRAVEDLSTALRLKPANAFAWHYRGKAWLEKEDYNKAIEDLNKAIALAPDADSYTDRGNALFEKRKYDKAISDYNKALALDVNHANACYGRAEVSYARKQYSKAIEDYTRFIALKPYDMLGYNNRGYAWRALNEYDKAIDDFTMSIGLSPNTASEWCIRGRTRFNKLQEFPDERNRFEEAIRDFDEAIRLAPDDWEAYYYRGVLYSSLEVYDKAIGDLEKAHQLDPDDKDLLRQLDLTRAKRLNAGAISEEEKQPVREQAASFIDKLRKTLNEKFKDEKEGYQHGWAIVTWDAANQRPLVAGIQGWLPAIRPDLAKWKEGKNDHGEKTMITCTLSGQEFWPSLAGIPIKKDLWSAIFGYKQYLIGENQLNTNVKRFPMVNLLLMRIITRIRSGDLDHHLVFGEYRLPTVMEEFESALKNILNASK